MSVWSEFDGEVSVKLDDHFSIRKAIESIGYDEFVLNVDFASKWGDVYVYNVRCAFPLDGESAVHYFNKVKELLDTKTNYDLTLTVRFIS